LSDEAQRNRIVLLLCGGLAALIAAGYFITHTFSALLTSLVLAYLLNPILKYLERRGFDRPTALGLLYGIGAFILFLSSFVLIPYFGHQFDVFYKAFPFYQQTIQGWLEKWKVALAGYYGGDEGIWLLDRLEESMAHWAAAISGLGYIQLKKLLFAGFNLLLAPILVFFMLLYKQNVTDFIKRMFHHRERLYLLDLGREINRSLERFLLGMLCDCLLVGLLTAIALKLIGVEFPILNGLFAGFASIVPFLGVLIAMIPPALIGYAQTGDIWLIPKVAAAYFVINVIIEGNLIKPLVMKHTMRLNPLAVIFAVMAMGELLGFWGLILAIPTAAVMKICTAEMREILHLNDRSAE
jgi:predicted PurR-regulated permease PerM